MFHCVAKNGMWRFSFLLAASRIYTFVYLHKAKEGLCDLKEMCRCI